MYYLNCLIRLNFIYLQNCFYKNVAGMTKLALFCVTYNSYNELFSFLDSVSCAITESGNFDVDVYVADNTEKNIKNLSNIYEDAPFKLKVFAFNTNYGYMGAISRMVNGIDCSEYDFIAISNVDLILSKDALSQLLSTNISDDIGWIAPALLSGLEKRDRNPQILKRYSIGRLKLLRLMFKYPILHYVYCKTFYKRKKMSKYGPMDIYAGHGSFMLFTKSFYSHNKTLDYPIFLYGEEIFLAELCRNAGLRVVYRPNIVIYDEEHVSTSKLKRSFYYKCNYEALDFLIRKFYT